MHVCVYVNFLDMFMDEDIDTSQTPFRPFNSNRVMSRSFDMSHNNPLRQNSMTGDSIFIQVQFFSLFQLHKGVFVVHFLLVIAIFLTLLET